MKTNIISKAYGYLNGLYERMCEEARMLSYCLDDVSMAESLNGDIDELKCVMQGFKSIKIYLIVKKSVATDSANGDGIDKITVGAYESLELAKKAYINRAREAQMDSNDDSSEVINDIDDAECFWNRAIYYDDTLNYVEVIEEQTLTIQGI